MSEQLINDVLLHFVYDDSSQKAECNICRRLYKATIANLKRHLKRKHNSTFTSLVSQHSNSLSTPKRKKISKVKIAQINSDLLDLFIDGLHPLSFVEEKAFKNFCKWIPGYELPTKKMLSDIILQQAYDKTLNQINEQIKNEVRSICLTADIWTSSAMETYIAITGHYFNDILEFKSVFLGCVHLLDYTPQKMATAIQTIVNRFDLQNKINYIVTDNSNHIVTAVEKILGWKHFKCYVHSLNSIVENALQLSKNHIRKVTEVVAFIQQSTASSEMLQKYQVDRGMVPKQLTQAVDARWISVLIMLRRFVDLKEAICSTLAFVDTPLLTITGEDWTLYGQLREILGVYKQVTDTMIGEKYFPGSYVIVITGCMKKLLQRFFSRDDLLPLSREIILLLQSGVVDHFEQIERNETLALCTFMDPRFKMLPFDDQNEAEKTKERVTYMVAELIAETENTKALSKPSDTEEVASECDSLWVSFDEMIESSTSTPLSRATHEIDMYLFENHLRRKDQFGNLNCPLEWWKNRQNVYPNLSKILINNCNIVATSGPCERMFSETGPIFNQRRTRLTTIKVEQIMFLNVNLPEARFLEYNEN